MKVPGLPKREKRRLVKTVAKHAAGKLLVSVQVTDNSVARILDNIKAAREDGAEVAVIAPPYFLLNANPRTLLNLVPAGHSGESESCCTSPMLGSLPLGCWLTTMCTVPDSIYRERRAQ